MKFIDTKFNDAFIIEKEPIFDERGFFCRNICLNELNKIGLSFELKQSSISYNKKSGTLRGMHFQKSPYSEIKIVSCIKGAIYDVILDLRPNSRTYRQWQSTILTESNRKSIYIPKGFAHGFQTLENECIVEYQISEFFYPEYYSGVLWNDEAFNITWPEVQNRIISEKDSRYEKLIKQQ